MTNEVSIQQTEVSNENAGAGTSTDRLAGLTATPEHSSPGKGTIVGVVTVVIVLTAVAAWLRRSNLAPSTLTHDDAWVAYIYRADYTDAAVIGMTSPGFVLLERVWLDIVGFSELRAQLLPWLAGIAAPAVFFVAMRRRLRPEVAVLGGLVLAYTPITVIYSSHVKQYTIEVLIGIALTALGLLVLDDVTKRRSWGLLCGATLLGAAISFSVAIAASGPLLAGSLKAVRQDRRVALRTLGWTVPTAIVVAVWYLAVLRPRLPEGLSRIWGPAPGREGRYITSDGGLLLWAESALNRISGVFAWLTPFDGRTVAAVVCFLLVVLLVRRPFVFLLCTTPLIAAIVLASLELAPLGGARTDVYFHAQLIAGAMFGLDESLTALARIWRKYHPSTASQPSTANRGWAIGVCMAIGAAFIVVGYRPPPYPLQDVAPLIGELETNRAPGDVVLVEWEAMYHLGLYGAGESRPVLHQNYGFRHYWVEFADDDVVRIHDPNLTTEYVRSLPESADRLWFLVSQNPFLFHTRDKWLRLNEELQLAGWELERVSQRQAALLEVWVREPQSVGVD